MPSWLKNLASAIKQYWRPKVSNTATANPHKKKKQTRRQNRKQWEEYRKRIADEQIVANYMAKQAAELNFCPELTAEPKHYLSEDVEEGILINGNGHFTILVLDDGPSVTQDARRRIVS